MLQIETHRTSTSLLVCRNQLNSVRKMPVDFASYLLAASPPGLGFYGFDNEFHAKGYSVKCHTPGRPLKPIIMKPKTFDDSEPTSPNSPCSPTSGCSSDDDTDETTGFIFGPAFMQSELSQRNKKKVTFADAKGLALTQVKLVTESSDTPPKLAPQLIASLTQGASADVSETPPLSLAFPQPASDYMNFRCKLNEQNVSLENVILKDYKVMGTVKVKNLSFHKHVFVRCSFDSWKSSTDIAAKYVSVGTEGSEYVMYDTFKFDISVPPTLRLEQAVEFCICFESDHGQFWDSADGKNYKIISTHSKDISATASPVATTPKAYTQDFKPNFNDVDAWTEYSSWSHIDRETPYY